MTALIARQYIDGSKADTPSGVSVANFQLGLGNAWDCLQTLGVGLAAVVAGTTALTQANAGLLLIDATAGNVILNLPAASAAVGAVFQFKRLDSTANSVTVNRAGSDTIDGSTSFTLNSQFDYQEIRGDGTSAWRVTTPKPVVLTSAGTQPAYTATTTPKVVAQVDVRLQVTWHASNSGATSTLALNGGTAVGIKQYDSTGAKIDPTIVSGVKSDLVYDGTHWVILDPLPPNASSQQPGEICFFARNTAPTGFLKANGALVSRTTYSNLYAAIGTTFGVGDGSTTFGLPDLRGEFLRGWDDARGVDSGRVFGTLQTDAMQGHRHLSDNVTGAAGGGGQPTVGVGSGGQTTAYTTSMATDGVNGTPRTAAETRPRNLALLACIKF